MLELPTKPTGRAQRTQPTLHNSVYESPSMTTPQFLAQAGVGSYRILFPRDPGLESVHGHKRHGMRRHCMRQSDSRIRAASH